MTKIIGLSGKKGSGKDSCANYLLGMLLNANQIVHGDFAIGEKGELFIADLFGNKDYKGQLDFHRRDKTFLNFRQQKIEPHVYLYRFADFIKNEICQDILGMTPEQVDNKDSVTHLLWERMPGVITELSMAREKFTQLGELPLIWHKSGNMTSREVQQFVGTNIFRKMFEGVWVDALIRRIKRDKPTVAIVTDVRFPNEVEALQENMGHIIRLTRNPFDDKHESENALNDYGQFDYIIDNAQQDRGDTFAELHNIISGIGIELPIIVQ